MKILVFGKSGQVARALASSAPKRGHEIVSLGRELADLSDPETCAARIAESDADAVINAAAWTAVDDAEDHEDAARVVNAAAPGAMARACAARGLPFVHISTDYVFDGSGTQPHKPGDATAPLGAYGRTKRAGEEAVCAAGGCHAILRTAWVFDGVGQNFVTTMLRLGESRDSLTIVADQIGGPTPAAAIAEACLTMAETLAVHPESTGIYHFSGAPDVSWAEFARAIFAISGQDVTVTDIPSSAYPTKAARPANSRLDCASLTDTFGIDRPDWQAALTRILKETPDEHS